MDQILDLDEQPPYVELYSHAPLMYMSLCNQRYGCAHTSPRDVLCWSHGVQCKIDDIASGLGLYKIKVLGNRGTSCLFAISPDMPPKQQAHIMFNAARELRQVLAQVLLPDGATLSSQITIHAGKYAGGIVGKGSWSYDLFGQDVHVLLDMDMVNSPNSIQVSDPALALLPQLQEQFAPACQVVCDGREVRLHRWLPQAIDSVPHAECQRTSLPDLPVIDIQSPSALGQQQQWQFHQDKAVEATAPGGTLQTCADPLLQQQQQQQLLAVKQAQHLCTAAGLHGSGTAGAASSRQLQFADAGLEGMFVQSQASQLARLDMLFVGVTLLLSGGFFWSNWGSLAPLELLLTSLAQWLVPLAAAAWYLVRPGSYQRHRELLWVLHRLLSSVNLAASLLTCMVQRQGLLQQATSAAGYLAADQRLEATLRREAVTMLADNLGFKVRFRAHLITAGLNAAVALLGVLWQWNTSSQLLWDLLLRLAVGCAAPTLLIYLWESEERAWFAGSTNDQAGTTSRMAEKVKHL